MKVSNFCCAKTGIFLRLERTLRTELTTCRCNISLGKPPGTGRVLWILVLAFILYAVIQQLCTSTGTSVLLVFPMILLQESTAPETRFQVATSMWCFCKSSSVKFCSRRTFLSKRTCLPGKQIGPPTTRIFKL